MVRDLIRRDEADPEAPDVLATGELSPAADIRDSVVVAGIVDASNEAARPRVQVTTIRKLAAIDEKRPCAVMSKTTDSASASSAFWMNSSAITS